MAVFLNSICVLWTLTLISTAQSSKLNVPRVLLPIFTDFSTKSILEAIDGGCYKWSTTRSDIIQLTPIDEIEKLKCSSKVLITTVTKEETRNIAVVLAEDVHTDQVLKCDIIVDIIHKLSVTTTTRELFMDEVPEAFQINAYDMQGNEFSTLEDVEFEWNIISIAPKKETTVLRYLPFKDSPYETPHAVKQLEEVGKKGSVILLEGVKTGTAKLTVRLPYQEYKHVESTEVTLTVIANLLLTPADIYIMPGDTLKFKVFFMHSGRLNEVKMPDDQYYLESEDMDIVSSSPKSSEVTALSCGKTHVLLHNKNINESDPAFKLPTATINVVQPAYIVLSILPHKNWAVLLGNQHEIFADVFSSTDHKLYLGPGVEIHTQVGDAFHIEERSQNGSWVTGWGVKEGKTMVQAKLESIVHPKMGKFPLETPVVAFAELFVYPRIMISPSEVILPWDPQLKPKYDVDLIAKGGDGRFLWTSSDHNIGMVTQNGHVRTISNGFFQVSAAMLRNHNNKQIAKFSILPPARLEIAEYIMEAEVGTPIFLHLALYAEKPGPPGESSTFIPFTQCAELPFQVRISDSKFGQDKSLKSALVGISCGNIAMIGQQIGTSKITVVYFHDGMLLEDSVTITAFNPLVQVHPDADVVLAVGTSLSLIFTGGPRPIIGRAQDHQRIVIVENEDIAQAEDVTESHKLPDDEMSVITILCKKLGETSLKLMISNTPVMPNCKSKATTLVTRIVCGKPRRIHVKPELKVADRKSCPMDLTADRVVVPSNQDIDLDVIVQDEVGRIFLNTTSLLYKWEAKPKKIRFKSLDGVIPKNSTIGSVVIANKSQQVVSATPEMGLIEVKVTIVGYNIPVLKRYKITPEFPLFLTGDERIGETPVITTTIGLFLVDNTEVKPNFTVVFNQPDSKKIVSVMHGSGYVELSLSADDLANVNYVEGAKQIEIAPLRSGEFTIQLIDLCLVAQPIYVFVRVVSVGRIEVEMSDKVQINHCISVVVRLYDELDKLLDIDQTGEIDIKHKFTKNIANLGEAPKAEKEKWPLGELHYVLTGLDIGRSELVFTFVNGDNVVSNPPEEFQVFPQLKLYPRNGTLLVGAALQLTIKGGPTPDCVIEFSTSSNKTAGVSDMGIVKGVAVGSTKLTAKSVGVHPTTGDKVVYSEDSVDIQVIKINGIKIHAPLSKFKVGATVPCWAVGIPETVSPLILGSFEDNSINFEWSLKENDVATLNVIFHPIGIMYRNSDKVAIQVMALQPGSTRLYLNVTLNETDAKKNDIRFSSFLDIEVFPAFTLVHPYTSSGKSLLMAQFSSVQLETNLDETCQLNYILANEHTSFTKELTTLDNNSPTTIPGLVSVTQTGLVESYGNKGFAMLFIIAYDASGVKQILHYIVQVRPVHYMMLSVLANWRIHLDASIRNVPLGTEFELVPKFYDNNGNVFNAGPKDIRVRSNRLDLIKVRQFSNNGSIHIATKKVGQTVLKVWSEGNDRTADYVKIHAEEEVKPIVGILTGGDIICLTTPVVSQSLQAGRWQSSNTDLISVDPDMDIAYVTGKKEGKVFLTHPLHRSAPQMVTVRPIAEIRLLPEPDTFLTNGPEGTTYRIPLVFRAIVGEDKFNNLVITRNFNVHYHNSTLQTHGLKVQDRVCEREYARSTLQTPYRCFIAFSNDSVPIDAAQIFTVDTSFETELGQYQCVLTATENNSSKVSTIETEVMVWAVADEGELESEPVNIDFTPNIYTEPEVVLSDNGNIGVLHVIGLTRVLEQVEVLAADSSIVYVSKGKLTEPTVLSFQIQLIDYHWKLADLEEAMGIVVNSPMTNQILNVMVRVTGTLDGTCGPRNSPIYGFLEAYKHALIVVISLIVIFCITCYVYSHYMQPVVNVNIRQNRTSLLGAQRLSTSVQGNRPQSPQTSTPQGNQPYISRMSPTAHICTNQYNCTCGSPSQTPVYGDSFACSSPELRRNRRFL